MKVLEERHGRKGVLYGSLDTTFFRDDFRRRDEPLKANATRIDFLVEGKRVVFLDDVLYTGRSIRAAMDAILSFGRPESIELMVFFLLLLVLFDQNADGLMHSKIFCIYLHSKVIRFCFKGTHVLIHMFQYLEL